MEVAPVSRNTVRTEPSRHQSVLWLVWYFESAIPIPCGASTLRYRYRVAQLQPWRLFPLQTAPWSWRVRNKCGSCAKRCSARSSTTRRVSGAPCPLPRATLGCPEPSRAELIWVFCRVFFAARKLLSPCALLPVYLPLCSPGKPACMQASLLRLGERSPLPPSPSGNRPSSIHPSLPLRAPPPTHPFPLPSARLLPLIPSLFPPHASSHSSLPSSLRAPPPTHPFPLPSVRLLPLIPSLFPTRASSHSSLPSSLRAPPPTHPFPLPSARLLPLIPSLFPPRASSHSSLPSSLCAPPTHPFPFPTARLLPLIPSLFPPRASSHSSLPSSLRAPPPTHPFPLPSTRLLPLIPSLFPPHASSHSSLPSSLCAPTPTHPFPLPSACLLPLIPSLFPLRAYSHSSLPSSLRTPPPTHPFPLCTSSHSSLPSARLLPLIPSLCPAGLPNASPTRPGVLLLRLGELKRANVEHMEIAICTQRDHPHVEFGQLWEEMFLNVNGGEVLRPRGICNRRYVLETIMKSKCWGRGTGATEGVTAGGRCDRGAGRGQVSPGWRQGVGATGVLEGGRCHRGNGRGRVFISMPTTKYFSRRTAKTSGYSIRSPRKSKTTGTISFQHRLLRDALTAVTKSAVTCGWCAEEMNFAMNVVVVVNVTSVGRS